MIFEAIYKNDGYEAALLELADHADGDYYYSRVWCAPYGCHVHRGDGHEYRPYIEIVEGREWPSDYEERIAAIATTLRDEGIAYGRWITCSGNKAEYHFDHDARTVRVRVEGARHGIPAGGLLRLHEPVEVVAYVTQAPSWWTPWDTADTSPRHREWADRYYERRIAHARRQWDRRRDEIARTYSPHRQDFEALVESRIGPRP